MISSWIALLDKPYIMWSILDSLLFSVPFLPFILVVGFWPLIQRALRKKGKK